MNKGMYTSNSCISIHSPRMGRDAARISATFFP